MSNRRKFLKKFGVATAATTLAGCNSSTSNTELNQSYQGSDQLKTFQEILKQTVFKRELFNEPIVIDKIEIKKDGDLYFTKVTSKNGAEGYVPGNRTFLPSMHGLMLSRIIPQVIGKDARDIEKLIEQDMYLNNLNYKWQGVAFWIAVAYVEIAVLDMLGKIAKKPIGELLGERVRDEVSIYYASGHRGNSPEDEVTYLQSLIEKSGAMAVKIRLGARMRYDEESMKRDRALIPLVRKTFGDDLTFYADANGSFDVPTGIEIGNLLSDYDADFFEEPCPFDHYEETAAISRTVKVPLAFGEEEVSMRQFISMLDKGIIDVPQPDLLFFGGMIRSIKLARMADTMGLPCVPHISGFGLGFLNTLHFVSCVPNAGDFQEYKGDKDQFPAEADESLTPVDGKITIPKAPGLGITIDPDLLKRAKTLTVF